MARIKTIGAELPEVYAYITPGVTYHDGWIKVGDTQGEFEKRVGQQVNTAGILADAWLLGYPLYEDGSRQTFRDTDFHQFLRERGVNDQHPGWPGNEWFEIGKEELRQLFNEFKCNPPLAHKARQLVLRTEQEDAIRRTVGYHDAHENGEFLWNAKPRFGKTVSAMEFCRRIDARTVLVLTNKPSVANSWYEDFCQYLGTDSGYVFVSETPDLKGKKFVKTRDEYSAMSKTKEGYRCFEFVSLQDLKGSVYYGGTYDKLRELQDLTWDAVFLDEAHEGVDTFKTEFALDKIQRRFTLHLTGTPFKQIRSKKFDPDAIFTWTYVDEQQKKEAWAGPDNPYEELPKLHMLTYRMSHLVEGAGQADFDEDGSMDYAYALNRFFEVKGTEFVHKAEVLKFLAALTSDPKFPLSDAVQRDALSHTFWLLPSVAACKAMAAQLRGHPAFSGYAVVNVSGDMKDDSIEEFKAESSAYGKVKAAIAEHDKTITLTVQRLTTGVTIPEWTGVFILSEMKSPQAYMQAAFRAQNPCIFQAGSKYYRKTDAYLFDFNPERSLSVIEAFANDLYADTADGHGDAAKHKENITRLLKYLPVAGEDEDGQMRPLDADAVLSIPRRIRSSEVVRRGFMCNFLFNRDFAGIFRTNSAAAEIISRMHGGGLGKNSFSVTEEEREGMHLNGSGNVEVTEEDAESYAEETFGSSSAFAGEVLSTAIPFPMGLPEGDPENGTEGASEEPEKPDVKKQAEAIGKAVLDSIKKKDDIPASAAKKIRADAEKRAMHAIAGIELDKKVEITKMKKEAKESFHDVPQEELESFMQAEEKEIEKRFSAKKEDALRQAVSETHAESGRIIQEEKAKRLQEGKIREIEDHLKGFARTVPSFLMAYGAEKTASAPGTTLATFEQGIPGQVFLDVTSITKEEFAYLRDGGDRIGPDGQVQHFGGHVFEETVFNDAVQEFLRKRRELADYFDEEQKEDIFDYIPPQKTNQIFTPKEVVKKMADMLEDENPGCFDADDRTFIDLYMKSGLYVAEIVKRLYRSEKMKEKYPDGVERLRHIFAKQVYGLAPTEIIYRIATNFVLGFDGGHAIQKHNLRQLDALECIRAGVLEEKLDEAFGDGGKA